MLRNCFFIFLICILTLGSYSPLFHFNQFEFAIILSSLSLVFLFLSSMAWKGRPTNSLLSSPLIFCLLLLYFWSSLGYFYTARLELSFEPVVKYAGVMFFVFGVSLYFRTEKQVKETLWFLLICSGALSFFGILQQYFPEQLSTVKNRFSFSVSIFPYSHAFSCSIMMHLPLSCYFYLNASNKKQKVISGVIFVLLMVALGFSGSRGGLVVACIIVFLVFGYLFSKKDFSGIINLLAGLVVSLSVYFLLVSIFRFFDPIEIQKPFVESFVKREWGTKSVIDRSIFWRGAWDIFKDHWLTGTGPGTFPIMYPEYSPFMTPPHAHSLYFQIASDTGIFGIGLLLISIFLFYRRAGYLFIYGNSENRDMVFYLGAVFTGFLIHSLIEYHWVTSIFIYLFTLTIVLVESLYIMRFPGKIALRALSSRVVFFMIFLLVLAGTSVIWNYYLYYRTVYQQANQGLDMGNMFTQADRAKNLCSQCDLPYLVLAGSLITQYICTENYHLLTMADSELQKASEISRQSSQYYFMLSKVRGFQGREEEGYKAYANARKYNQFKVTGEIGFDAMDEHLEEVTPGFASKPGFPMKDQLGKLCNLAN